MAWVGACAKLVRLEHPLPGVYCALITPRRILELHQAICTGAGGIVEHRFGRVPYLQGQALFVGTPVFCCRDQFHRIGSRCGVGEIRVFQGGGIRGACNPKIPVPACYGVPCGCLAQVGELGGRVLADARKAKCRDWGGMYGERFCQGVFAACGILYQQRYAKSSGDGIVVACVLCKCVWAAIAKIPLKIGNAANLC